MVGKWTVETRITPMTFPEKTNVHRPRLDE